MQTKVECVSDVSHSWIAMQEQSPTPISFMSRVVLMGDQMEVKTQGNIILTQGLGLVCKEQRRSGILTSASGLIKR
jgi:hypothetical protein